MGKIKINLANGSIMEKPLVSCFQGSNGNYLVLDNETNGSMGLPIICISKFNSNKAEKITDTNEWSSVKENLKSIIAGNNLPYINVPESITAGDDFFTQLTLPVASFDVLKNNYQPTTVTQAPIDQSQSAPIPEIPVVADNNIPSVPSIEMPNVETPTPLNSEVVSPIQIEPTIISAPAVEQPVISAEPIVETPVLTNPISNVVDNTIQAVENAGENGDIASIKENFLKSCETMFDALVKQFNK